jgi:carbonic anhydrase/acetyltransferase-like protein (isoleucine patch superfamily)
MMLKVKRTHIQDGCTVAFGTTVMGGAVIERDTTLLPLSLVLKEMNMITATYEGSPAEPVSGSTLLPRSLCDEAVSLSNSPEKAATHEKDRDLRSSHGLR